jgi:hypothetical protein
MRGNIAKEEYKKMSLPGLKIVMHFVMDFTAVRESEPAEVNQLNKFTINGLH